MTSPQERARLLDAEMQLQRAWLELNIREWQAEREASSWPGGLGGLAGLAGLSGLRGLQWGRIGLALLKHRSLWLAGLSLLLNLYRRRTKGT